MANIKFSSKSLRGDSITVDASAGGSSATQRSTSDWGGGSSGGTVSITVDRTRLQTAPDTVRFGVDLSKATFDTSEAIPEGSPWAPPYDERHHLLHYFWDFGETRDYTATENVHPNWVSARYAKGPWVSHCYHPDSISGNSTDFTVTLLVVEPSSGKTATATTTVTVYHPDYTYGGSRPGYTDFKTYVVNPDGDTDFTGKPTGATELTLDGTHGAAADKFDETITAWTTEATAGNKVRWLFKRGSSYNFGVDIQSGDEEFQYFGVYGSGSTRATLNNVGGDSIQTRGTYTFGSDVPELRVVDVNFDGGFDPALDEWPTGANAANHNVGGVTSSGFDIDAKCTFIVQSCDLRGMWFFAMGSYPDAAPHHMHFDNVKIYEYACSSEFNIITGVIPTSTLGEATFSMTGCSQVMYPSGPGDFTNLGTTEYFHGMCRLNAWTNIHVRCCDFYHCGYTNAAMQPHMKANRGAPYSTTPDYETTFPVGWPPDGVIVNIHSTSVEGNSIGFSRVHPEGTYGPCIATVVYDDCFFASSWFGMTRLSFAGQGCTVRNCYAFASTQTNTGYGFRNFMETVETGPYQRPRFAPIRVYNNTCLVYHTQAQTVASSIGLYKVSSNMQGRIRTFFFNNVFSAPSWSSIHDGFVGELDETTIGRFNSRRLL